MVSETLISPDFFGPLRGTGAVRDRFGTTQSTSGRDRRGPCVTGVVQGAELKRQTQRDTKGATDFHLLLFFL